jgi:hypothetical protein
MAKVVTNVIIYMEMFRHNAKWWHWKTSWKAFKFPLPRAIFSLHFFVPFPIYPYIPFTPPLAPLLNNCEHMKMNGKWTQYIFWKLQNLTEITLLLYTKLGTFYILKWSWYFYYFMAWWALMFIFVNEFIHKNYGLIIFYKLKDKTWKHGGHKL